MEVNDKQMPSVLVVDDERSMREFLEILLSKENYRVTLAANGEEAFRILEKDRFDLLITDIRMQDVDGIDVLKKAKSLSPETIVIMISAFATAETAVEAMREGAYDYIPKPFKVRDFKKIIKDALDSRRPAAASTEEKSIFHFGCLVGDSPQMKRVYDLLKRWARPNPTCSFPEKAGPERNWWPKPSIARAPEKTKPLL
jgi:two-component system, NtrC family, response regulator PilR